jgi:hypothetical protein
MTMPADTRELTAALNEEAAGPVLQPGHLGVDYEIKTFTLAATYTPALVVGATNADDVRAAVRHAAKPGLPVGVQPTGRGALAPIDEGVLISTHRMNSVHVNPRNATSSVGAGTRWADVIKAAAVHGLAPLSGSCSSVGAVGYTLGGGVPIMARTFGYAADHVRSLDGSITFPGLAAPALLRAYREWTRHLPKTMSTTLSLVRLPPLPSVPEARRGQFVVDLHVAYVGDREGAEQLLAPMRAAAPAVSVLRALDMTDGAPSGEPGLAEPRYLGRFLWLRCRRAGWWEPVVGPGDAVASGQVIGTVTSLDGADTLETITAPADFVVPEDGKNLNRCFPGDTGAS